MFRGRSRHTLDDKGRLAIPTRFKEVLDQKGEDGLIVTTKDDALWAFTKSDWRILEEKAAKIAIFNDAGIAFLRYFISGATECLLKNGRITIPVDMREDVGLNKEVVLVGQLSRFEIWDRDKWEEEFRRVKAVFHETSPSLIDLSLG